MHLLKLETPLKNGLLDTIKCKQNVASDHKWLQEPDILDVQSPNQSRMQTS